MEQDIIICSDGSTLVPRGEDNKFWRSLLEESASLESLEEIERFFDSDQNYLVIDDISGQLCG